MDQNVEAYRLRQTVLKSVENHYKVKNHLYHQQVKKQKIINELNVKYLNYT